MDRTENAVDGRDANNAPRVQPENAFEQWFLARDVLRVQLDAENLGMLDLASMAHELQGLWEANEPILIEAYVHGEEVAVEALLRGVVAAWRLGWPARRSGTVARSHGSSGARGRTALR